MSKQIIMCDKCKERPAFYINMYFGDKPENLCQECLAPTPLDMTNSEDQKLVKKCIKQIEGEEGS